MAEGSAEAVEDIEAQGFKQTAKDLFAGAAGGITQVLVGKQRPVYLLVCDVL